MSMDPAVIAEREALKRKIRETLLEMVDDHPKGLLMEVAATVGTIYPNVYKMLRELMNEQLIEPRGATKGRQYFLTSLGRARLEEQRKRNASRNSASGLQGAWRARASR